MTYPIKLRYDGKYDAGYGLPDPRQWTIRSHTVANGRCLYNATFTGAKGLLEVLGIAKPA
jgi:hypothetical protein